MDDMCGMPLMGPKGSNSPVGAKVITVKRNGQIHAHLNKIKHQRHSEYVLRPDFINSFNMFN